MTISNPANSSNPGNPAAADGQRLIFDVGMHHGQDTAYYLIRGHRVVAVDADPGLIERARSLFAKDVAEGRLVLAHCAISEDEGSALDFYISETDEWNSLRREIAERRNASRNVVKVPGRRLASLVEQYGVPYYCKIDIEGYDDVALRTLVGSSSLPKFVSVESECAGDQKLSEEQALETLESLRSLGYRRFKLIDQSSLAPLSPNRRHYSYAQLARKAVGKVLGKFVPGWQPASRRSLQKKFNYPFASTATGPFGDDLAGQWFDYETSKQLLLRHRRDYFNLPNAVSYGFWCDWHATV